MPRPPDFVVLPVPSAADERFIVVETATTGAMLYRPFAEPGSTSDRLASMMRVFESLPQLREDEVRAQLSARGVSEDEIAAWLYRARTFAERAAGATLTNMELETITRIGYRNRDGQEIVRKTEQAGPDNQRVFVMRCGVCGHEYGSYGIDADIRRCPACQDGPPGVSTPLPHLGK